MWKYLPEDRRAEYAETDEEATRWVDGAVRRAARRTRAGHPSCRPATTWRARSTPRCEEGRGSPHGGVFLDISYLPADHVRRKLPSMYEQFKELADVDITRGPMEVGPTTHYVMGGIRVDAETGATTTPGLYAAGEVAAGMHGANRLGGNSLSDLLVFGARAGAAAARRAADQAGRGVPGSGPDPGCQRRARGAARATAVAGEDPYAIQRDLQEVMQRLVGIFREEADLDEAIRQLADLRASLAAGQGNRRAGLQSRLEPGLRARQPADRVRGDHPERSPADREPRGAQPPRLPGHRRRQVGRPQQRRRPGGRRVDVGQGVAAAADARRAAQPARQRALTTEDRCRTHT